MDSLKVGLVGAGTIGAIHAELISRMEQARVVAVADPNEAAGRSLARQHQAVWWSSLESLLATSDVDAVLLASPSGLHREQGVLIARAGKHVITEKPIALDLAGAEELIDECRDCGVRLAAIFQYRFHRDALRLKRAIAAGMFGQILYGNAFVHWHRSDDYYRENGGWRGTKAMDGGGSIINQTIHAIDLLQWVVGPVESVGAYTATLRHSIEGEDTACVAVRFRSGALGTIQGATSVYTDLPWRIQIVGTAGEALLEKGRLTVWQPAREEDVLDAADLTSTRERQEGEPWWSNLGLQLRLIVAALREGRQPPVPGEDARDSLAIISAIYRSAQTRGVVPVLPRGSVAYPGASEACSSRLCSGI